MTLRISDSNNEGVYQGSKWLKLQILCDREDLMDLFQRLPSFWIFPLTGIVDGKSISHDCFLDEYGRWIASLKMGSVPKNEELKRVLACAFVEDLQSLWLQKVAKGYLTKIKTPVVQVQAHFFTYSPIDGVFRPMSMGSESVFWGLQFSYPQIYQDGKTMEFREVKSSPFFRTIQLWMREKTRSTPFLVGGKRINAPIRIGKNCFSWIHNHPQLIQQNIGIDHD